MDVEGSNPFSRSLKAGRAAPLRGLLCWGSGYGLALPGDAATQEAPDAQQARRVDPVSVEDLICLELLARYGRVGVRVGVWDVTSDVGGACRSVPCAPMRCAHFS